MDRVRLVHWTAWIAFLLTPALEASEVAAKKIEASVIIDGDLSEEAWLQTDVITGFTQFEPRYGETASLSTTIRVLYDRTSLYFGIECRDSDPSRISSKVTRRDGEVWEDDSIALIIDTFNDKNNAYMFQVNALGTQQDERWADNGRTRDVKWDATWSSAGARFDGGWTAEVAIPFASLRFDRNASEWGFDVIRYIPRNLEMSRWSPNLTEWFRISEFGSISELELSDIITEKLTLIPYSQAQFEEDQDPAGDIGLDIRYTLSSNMAAEGTFNPDFATIEADVEQINLTRFELSFPEKRPFFLEGAENYSTRIRQFYSRRIGEIPWGAKLNGKSGKLKFNLLGTQSDPSSANPRIAPGDDAYYSIFRVGYDLQNASNIGIIGANRNYQDENKGSMGMAGTFFFTDVLGMTTQVIKSYGPFDTGTWTYFFRPAYDSRTTHFHVRYTHVGEHVRENMNDVGFIRDDDRKELDTNLRRRFWLNQSFFEEIRPSVNYNQYWGQDGVLRSWHLTPTLGITFLKKWTLTLRNEEEFKLFEKEFRNSVYGGTLRYDNKTGNLYTVGYQTGRNFDRDFDSWGVGVTLKLREGWNFDYELKRLEFRPDPDDDSTFIHNLRSTYYFNTDLYLKFFYQSRQFLSDGLDSEEDRETLQCVFVWRFLPPFGQIQLAYMQGPTLVTEAADRYHTVFAKLAWVFQR